MSREVATLVYRRKVGSVHRKAVLAYFAERADDGGRGIWASKQTIADETECGRSTVIKIIGEFLEEGILKIAGTRPCQNGSTVVYDMNLAAIAALPKSKDEPVHELDRSTSGTSPDMDGSTNGTPPVHQRDPMGSTSGTQTVLEPSLEEIPPISPPAEKPPAKARLPDGWVPSEKMIDVAMNQFGLTAQEIEVLADDFHGYWQERGDASARKTERGWLATWRNRLEDRAPAIRRNRQVASGATPFRGGQGSSIASIAARRRASGEV